MSAISTTPCTLPFRRQAPCQRSVPPPVLYRFGGNIILEASAVSAISTAPCTLPFWRQAPCQRSVPPPCTLPFWRQAPCQRSVPPPALYRFGGKRRVSSQYRPMYFTVLEARAVSAISAAPRTLLFWKARFGGRLTVPHNSLFFFLKEVKMISCFRHFQDFVISMISPFP